jgi:hypothetical protein
VVRRDGGPGVIARRRDPGDRIVVGNRKVPAGSSLRS